MFPQLSPDFKPMVVTKTDLTIASIAWGFTLGFGFLTVWTAVKQTTSCNRRYGTSKLNTPYIWMIWLEIIDCFVYSIVCWLHLNGNIPPSFAFFFADVTFWALQVQLLLQIIINRICLLLTDRRKGLMLKLGVAFFVTLINISVYFIWLPARLQISLEWQRINLVWDRCEKVLYLIIDAALNYYFIRTVRNKLVRNGLTKYDRLVRFNILIVGFSLAMDLLTIGSMSLNNTFVYSQMHPLAYIVKLNIEMSMTDLIVKLSLSTNNPYKDQSGLSRLNQLATQEKSSSNTTLSRVPTLDGPIASHFTNSNISVSKIFRTSADIHWRGNSSSSDDLPETPSRQSFRERDISLNMKREVRVVVERRHSIGNLRGSFNSAKAAREV